MLIVLALGNCRGSGLLGLGGDGPADGTLQLRLQVTPHLACDQLVLCNLTNTSRCAPCWWGGGAGAVRAVPEPCPRNLSRIQCEMSP